MLKLKTTIYHKPNAYNDLPVVARHTRSRWSKTSYVFIWFKPDGETLSWNDNNITNDTLIHRGKWGL